MPKLAPDPAEELTTLPQTLHSAGKGTPLLNPAPLRASILALQRSLLGAFGASIVAPSALAIACPPKPGAPPLL